MTSGRCSATVASSVASASKSRKRAWSESSSDGCAGAPSVSASSGSRPAIQGAPAPSASPRLLRSACRASARPTCTQGQYAGAPPPSQQLPQAQVAPRVAACSTNSRASAVLPMPGLAGQQDEATTTRERPIERSVELCELARATHEARFASVAQSSYRHGIVSARESRRAPRGSPGRRTVTADRPSALADRCLFGGAATLMDSLPAAAGITPGANRPTPENRLSTNSFDARSALTVGARTVDIYRLDALAPAFDVARLPFSLKILLENLLRTEGNGSVTAADIEALAGWDPTAAPATEIAFTPARVVMQDFTGVPAVVDLAAMRDAMAAMGGDPALINPLVPAELVIDHSVQVDAFGSRDAFTRNAEREFERNEERYAFLRWGQTAFDNFAVVPPDTGIVHQVNLEYLARVVFVDDSGLAYPDTLVGTDSHTTMINGLGVLGWGVGGIEAEAAMLGQPMPMLIPEVVGFKLRGVLPEGATATDLVLTVTEMLRERGVVGKFVEFYGQGLASLPLADRATIGNMSPEFGSTCAIFPIDAETIRYLEFSGRPPELIELVEAYAREQGLWHDESSPEPVYSDTIALDLGDVVPSLAGPRRPQDRVALSEAQAAFRIALKDFAPQETATTARPRSATRSSSTRCRFRPPTRRRSRAARASGRRSTRPMPTTPTRSPPRARPATSTTACRSSSTAPRRARQRPRRDRRDHELHEHLQPVGHARRGPARAQRRRARADEQAVGQDVARARLEGRHEVPRPRGPDRRPRGARLSPRRLRLHDLHRQLRPAAARRLRGGRRARPRRRLGAVGQPQLRGAHQPRREDELPRLAAARRRLRARGLDGRRHRARSDRRRSRRGRCLPARSVAVGAGGRRDGRARGALGDVPLLLRRRLRRRRALELARRADRRPLRVGRGARPTSICRRTSTACPRSPASSRTSRARACWRCSATRSRPTTSRRPARSSPTRPPACTCRSTASRRATSTPTARAAATTRSWCAARSPTSACATSSRPAPRAA